jgi:cytochrome c peroxidase
MLGGVRVAAAASISAVALLSMCPTRHAVALSFSPEETRQIARLSPLPPPPPDASNRVADDPAAALLGQLLFFAPSLSRRGDVACATCHDPRRGWSNGQAVVATGTRFPRHVPSLWNTAYNRWFFWDGRADSAWAQALGPLENDAEMATTRLRLAHQLGSNPALRRAYERVFGPLPSALTERERFPPDGRPLPENVAHPHHVAWSRMTDADRAAVNRIFSNVGRALAAYERRIISRDAPFDRFVEGFRDGDAAKRRSLSEAGQRGLRLFIGRGECVLCHSGPNFSDGEFHDVGIALGKGMRIDPGRYAGVRALLADPFNRAGMFSDCSNPLAPVRFLHLQSDQLAQFKTPTLRDVAGSAPYMHDGRFGSLDAVVRFYSTRAGATPFGHPVNLLRPLDLSESEVADLVAFLESLSGRPLARSLTERLDVPAHE